MARKPRPEPEYDQQLEAYLRHQLAQAQEMLMDKEAECHELEIENDQLRALLKAQPATRPLAN
jgi:hypothetical protein